MRPQNQRPLLVLEETDGNCKSDEECVPKDSCLGWLQKLEEKKCLEQRSEPFGDIWEEVKQAVCNKKDKGVCCNPEEVKEPNFKCYRNQDKTVKDVIRPVIDIGPAFQRIAAEALKEGMANLAQSMYLHLLTYNLTNFVFSPLSLHSILSMLYLGATRWSDTSEELAKALGVLNNHHILKLAHHNIVKTYTAEQNFRYGNNIWVQSGFPINETFVKLVRDNMNSDIGSLDFAEPGSVTKVNEWVTEMTGGMIDSLDNFDSFSPDTTLFIANVIYFNEKWEISFMDRDLVTGNKLMGDFQTAESGFVNAPFIEQKSNQIRYQRINNTKLDLEVITIPYKNPLFEMQIILPKNVRDMRNLEGRMQLSDDQLLNPRDKNFFNIFTEDNRIESVDFIDDVFLKMPTFKIKTDLDAAEPFYILGVDRVCNFCTNQP